MFSIRCGSHVKLWWNQNKYKYNWEGIDFPSEKNDWKKFLKNNAAIALDVLCVEKEKIYRAYV